MSKISGGGGNRDGAATAGETLAKLRDHFTEKERENEARHRGELSELRAAHQAELDKVRKDSQTRIESIRGEHAERVSQKDMHFQKEIESIRNIYQKRLIEARRGHDGKGDGSNES